MATVFLAHDTKHGRDLAIKVLNPALAESLTAERFLREIGITARLNHPHILPLLDSGAAGDGKFLYYVMPVATGESLRDKLARDGAMPVRDAVHYAIEITEALVAAHATVYDADFLLLVTARRSACARNIPMLREMVEGFRCAL